MARTGFHPAPGVDVSDADAGVGDVKDPKTFYSVAAPKKTGTMATQTLNPANEDVTAGYYATTTLSAVDGDLATGNIKQGETIFGFAGTVVPGGVETIENYANAVLANNATYTPTDPGIFYVNLLGLQLFQYQTTDGWYSIADITQHDPGAAISDGTNFRLKNLAGSEKEYIMFRHHLSTGTYERARDEDLAASATWTPANAGFFACGTETTSPGYCRLELNYGVAGWSLAGEFTGSDVMSIVIGDGTDLRVANTDGGNARWHCTMRAVMT